ncbi:endonuclease-3 [Haloplanus vescus]|uniref:Endonuclease-3 n=1 Tax=Haloplanus vescus TaxID=555874 RepID=A0A1H3Y7K9_9EURY|nr:GIY-YIG nuclease family protein [Haloplanus vescus]SEA07490.1 endonuclease-3 [Haloplanus vescus]
MADSTGGTYTLVLALDRPVTIEVGALGDRAFPAGAYAYTGSALGQGGFARVDRHRRVAAGEHDVRHWHVDYLTGHPAVELVDVVRAPGADVECAVAARLPQGPVAGFGASDCDCRSHLAADEDVDRLRERVTSAHRAVTED